MDRNIFNDIQKSNPENAWAVSRVGILGTKELVKITTNEGYYSTIGKFDVFVDLPSHLRGIHMSRNSEAINEAIWGGFLEKFKNNIGEIEAQDIGSLCLKISNFLLVKHDYSSKSEVIFIGDFILTKTTPITQKITHEIYGIYCSATSIKIKNSTTSFIKLGVEVVGTTVCPCAQNEIKKKFLDKSKEEGKEDTFNDFIQTYSFPSHMQRVIGRLSVEMPSNEYIIQPETLIKILENSMSAETFELLKREDEVAVVEGAFGNPLFVEDVVRLVTSRLVNLYGYDHPSWRIKVSIKSLESIHKHDAFAEISSSFEDILSGKFY